MPRPRPARYGVIKAPAESRRLTGRATLLCAAGSVATTQDAPSYAELAATVAYRNATATDCNRLQPTGPRMITVHHLNNSRSQRVLWLLEELGLDYQIRRYERDAKTMLAPPELKAVHPLGKSPVITDGKLTLAESGAILQYLADEYDTTGRLQPKSAADRRRVTYWMHYAEGSAMPPLLMKLVFDRIETTPLPIGIKQVARGIAAKVKDSFVLPQITTHLDFMEGELAQSTWFAGDKFSLADIQMSFPVEAAAARAGLDARRPRLMAFWNAFARGRPISARWKKADRSRCESASKRSARQATQLLALRDEFLVRPAFLPLLQDLHPALGHALRLEEVVGVARATAARRADDHDIVLGRQDLADRRLELAAFGIRLGRVGMGGHGTGQVVLGELVFDLDVEQHRLVRRFQPLLQVCR
jgi:glutathione S-transferase